MASTESTSPSLMSVYHGWDGYQQSLVSAIAPRTPEELQFRISAGARSVGEIAGHIAFGRVDWFQRMGAPGSEALATQIAPLQTPAGEAVPAIAEDPQAIVHWLNATWKMIETVLTQWTVDDLVRTYPHRYWDKTYAVSYQWTIWRIMAHDIHHGGQLSIVMAAQGIELPDLGDNGGHIIMPPLVDAPATD